MHRLFYGKNMNSKSKMVIRVLIYILGLIILALGIVLNTKTNLGVSPIISVAYVASNLTATEFANMTLAWYILFVVFEVIVHICRGEKRRLVSDVLQIVLSVVFTRFMQLFDHCIPELTTMWVRIVLLIVAIILTGIGIFMSVQMKFVPNPGDGIVQTLAELTGLKLGTMKNIFDCSCVAVSVVLGLIFKHAIIGIGIGTVLAMLGVGRVVAVVNRLFEGKAKKLLED